MTTAVEVTTGALLARRPLGAYHELTIEAPAIARAARPGQFISVGVDAPDTLLRRPFAVAGADAAAGTLRLVIAVVGTGAAWLISRPVSTVLDLVGPLGTAFTPPATHSRCVLVGGGYGVAPLAWLAERLVVDGHTVELLSGARSAASLYPLAGAGAVSTPAAVYEVTEDGGRGRRGLVTDVLGERLASPPGGRGTVGGEGERQRAGGRGTVGGEGERQRAGGRGTTVFACGPMPMLAAVARLCAGHQTPCQVAVEEHMGCSVGVCMTCVVPTVDGSVRSCIDGPVLDGQRVDWTRVPGCGP